MPFNRNVFINCPFDKEYKKLIQPLLFTLAYCKLEPQISETSDSGNARFEKIQKLILASKFSIHDLSRMEALHSGDLPRYNLPFELGLDIGCKTFLKGKYSTKKILIFEKEKFRYQKVLSDISGFDIYAHENNQAQLIYELRNWLQFHFKQIPPGGILLLAYNEFSEQFSKYAVNFMKYKVDAIDEIPIKELLQFMNSWIKNKHFIS